MSGSCLGRVALAGWRWRRALSVAAAVVSGLTVFAGPGLTAAGAAARRSPARLQQGAPAADLLAGVSCPTGRRCVAVGQTVGQGGALAAVARDWNGQGWTALPVPVPAAATGSALAAVSCAAARLCVAVGYYRNAAQAVRPLVERWNGRTWTRQTIAGPGLLLGVSCLRANRCAAVGSTAVADGDVYARPVALLWNGRKWTRQRLPRSGSFFEATLTGVSCASAGACMAVGGDFGGNDEGIPLAYRWNGRRWAFGQPPGPSRAVSGLDGVACASARTCRAVGDSSDGNLDYATLVADRWNGRRWRAQHTPSPAGSVFDFFAGIACPAVKPCFAVGYSNNSATLDPSVTVPMIQRWGGAHWRLQTAADPGSAAALEGVSCSSATACTAVGGAIVSGTPVLLAERWDGSAWTVQPVPSS